MPELFFSVDMIRKAAKRFAEALDLGSMAPGGITRIVVRIRLSAGGVFG